MEFNTTGLSFNETLQESNVTLEEIVNFLNLNLTNITNESEETKVQLFDLYEVYKSAERDRLVIYKSVSYVLGTLIILSNLVVVISSGLILKKGQQPKSTYLLLGNVSLADTIIGLSIIFGAIADNTNSSDWLCVVQIGMIVCPTMVSIFSVGLIAVDRYIYILHGLYYQRWFNTTRVRIAIVIIWVAGIIIAFAPAFIGWKKKEYHLFKCHYFNMYPDAMILINCMIKISIITCIVILYTIILVKAINNVKAINALKNNYNSNNNIKPLSFWAKIKLLSHKRTKEFSSQDTSTTEDIEGTFSKIDPEKEITDKVDGPTVNKPLSESERETTSSTSEKSLNHDVISGSQNQIVQEASRTIHKTKDSSVWRAIIVVVLTAGSILFTWLPLFVLAVVYILLCSDDKETSHCYNISEVSYPFTILGFFNSFLNPLIYAWWHKGFKQAVKNIIRKNLRKKELDPKPCNKISKYITDQT